MKFEFLEHTADIKLKIYGVSKEELFKNALYGMFKAGGYKSEDKEDKRIKREITLESSDLESLLVDFLSEALYLSEVNQEAYDNVEFEQFSAKKLRGMFIGKKLKQAETIIKGVTYHDLEVKSTAQGWQATILFDI